MSTKVIIENYRGRVIHVAPYAGRFYGNVDPVYNLFGNDYWNPVTDGYPNAEDARNAAKQWVDDKHEKWRKGRQPH